MRSLRGLRAVAAAALVIAGGTMAGCRPPASASHYDASLPLKELMGHVMEPSADKFWRGSGSLYDRTGLHDLTPTTEEGWERVQDGAATLIEVSNLLRTPERARAPLAEWNRHVGELDSAAKAALAAADRHDVPAMMSVGSRMDVVCDGCHERFMTPEQLGPPSAPAAVPRT